VDFGAGAIRLAGRAIRAEFDGAHSERLDRALVRISEDVARRLERSGNPAAAVDAEPLVIRIRCESVGSAVPGISEDEAYWLVVDDAGVFLDAATEWGVLRGLTTFGQLLRSDGSLPHAAVDDAARFPWRGLLLDPARRFLPVEALLRTLDGMAACKLNVLHLHLSDDQGFRFPVPALPRLASTEAYTAAELTRLVTHAADRGIRVVPEIDMPGHVTSWLTAYPELGARQVGATERFGVHPACLDPTNEAVYDAIAEVLNALAAVFPDPCLHIGGDEVSPGWWSADAAVRALMERESLADVRAVQAYFNRRVGKLVTALGRRVVAWDEALHPQLPEDWIVQAWRGSTARDRALTRGNPVVVSAPYYLDLNYPMDVHHRFDPGADQAELVTLEDELLTDPRFAHVADGIRWTNQWREEAVPDAAVSDAAQSGLLGAEACLWGELVDADVLDVRLWSRLPALAERFWSPAGQQGLDNLYRRVDGFLDHIHPLRGIDLALRTRERFESLGIEGDWQELIDMLEPVKWYGRLLGNEALAARIEGREMPQGRPYTVTTPMNALVDHLPPESRRARRIAGFCEREAAGEEEAAGRLEEAALRWRALDAARDRAPAGLAEPAARLGRLAELVLARLTDGEPVPEDTLAEIARPMGELMIALPPGLHRWLCGS
jgi:hexosaminidase